VSYRAAVAVFVLSVAGCSLIVNDGSGGGGADPADAGDGDPGLDRDSNIDAQSTGACAEFPIGEEPNQLIGITFDPPIRNELGGPITVTSAPGTTIEGPCGAALAFGPDEAVTLDHHASLEVLGASFDLLLGTEQQWIRVAVSMGVAGGARMLQRNEATATFVEAMSEDPLFFLGESHACGDDSSVDPMQDLELNTNDLVLGASNSNGSPLGLELIDGAIDHFRFADIETTY
jgi:hypothetical protein